MLLVRVVLIKRILIASTRIHARKIKNNVKHETKG